MSTSSQDRSHDAASNFDPAQKQSQYGYNHQPHESIPIPWDTETKTPDVWSFLDRATYSSSPSMEPIQFPSCPPSPHLSTPHAMSPEAEYEPKQSNLDAPPSKEISPPPKPPPPPDLESISSADDNVVDLTSSPPKKPDLWTADYYPPQKIIPVFPYMPQNLLIIIDAIEKLYGTQYRKLMESSLDPHKKQLLVGRLKEKLVQKYKEKEMLIMTGKMPPTNYAKPNSHQSSYHRPYMQPYPQPRFVQHPPPPMMYPTPQPMHPSMYGNGYNPYPPPPPPMIRPPLPPPYSHPPPGVPIPQHQQSSSPPNDVSLFVPNQGYQTRQM